MSSALSAAIPAIAVAEELDIAVDELIVTGTRPEARSRQAGTVQVVDSEVIAQSGAQSVTELLSQNAVGFLNQWTPAQTAINIRGGASDGQGRDFKSQVLVLVNGRRAGTANISKFSAFDTSRIEVVRGPSSVAYGSQNIGGVLNVITKTGLTNPGAHAQFAAGSWGLATGQISAGGVVGPFDFFGGVSAGEQDDFSAGEGGGEQRNTSWERRGASAQLGYQITEGQRLALALRTDGVYDAGFRGSAANIYSYDNRYNNSADLTYTGAFLGGRAGLSEHLYAVEDVDDLIWASPVTRSSAGVPTSGTSLDHNLRRLEVVGSQFRPQYNPWAGNSLVLGWDWERSIVRSSRYRVGVNGAAIAQLAPYDNNQTETFNAYYLEDVQSLFDERLILRAGLRYTKGETTFDPTPNLAGVRQTTRPYDATTYSVGLSYLVAPGLRLRASAASGFRAPNATELAANFVTLGGGQTYGNANLEPETSEQIEVGLNYVQPIWNVDVALFRNTISDRVITRVRSGTVNVSDYVNNPGDVFLQGIEAQLSVDILEALGRGAEGRFWRLSANGNYNFDMKDKGAAATANTDNAQRVYRTQASLTTRFGNDAGDHPWSGQLQAVYSGPVSYDTEENLLIPAGEPRNTWIHQVDSYWLLNARAEVGLNEKVRLFAAANNLLDENYNPLLIGIDKGPYILDPRFVNGGGLGTSAPGRSFQVGVKLSFGS